MSAYRRNVMIGATVLGALIALVWMILIFGGDVLKPFAPSNIPVSVLTPRADGISIGSQVYYRGVICGKVTAVERLADNQTVRLSAEVDATPPLPANVEARIRLANVLGGGAGIYLELIDDAPPAGQLAAEQVINSRYVGLDVLPPEFALLADELRKTSVQFRESNVVGNLSTQITKAGTLLDSMQGMVGDKKWQEDLKTTIANFRAASESATVVATNAEKFTAGLPKLSAQASGTLDSANKNIETLSKSVGDRLSQLATSMDHLQSILDKVDKGDGTVGKLVNDPKMYQNLLETSDQLSAGSKDLRRLLEQWEQEGISFKLK